MPVNQMIARGFPAIGRDLPQIANMLYQRDRDVEQDRRRNELVDIERAQMERQNRALDLQERRFTDAENEGKSLVELQMLYDLAKSGDRNAINTAIERISAVNPEVGARLREQPDKVATVLARRLGIEEPGKIETVNLPGYGMGVTQGGKWLGGRPTPSYAPERPPQPQWVEKIDENGNRWVYDANSPNPNSTLRPLQTPGGRQIGSPPRVAADSGSDLETYLTGGSDAKSPLPAGIPPGSVQIGTSGGKPVYETPNGQRLIVE